MRGRLRADDDAGNSEAVPLRAHRPDPEPAPERRAEDPRLRAERDRRRLRLPTSRRRRCTRHELSRVHVIAGFALDYRLASSAGALDHHESALRLIEPRREPRLVGVVLHNLGNRLISLGRPEDGLYFLRRALAVLHRIDSPVNRARTLWSASWGAWMQGRFDTAIDRLEIVAHRLGALGQPVATGLAFLDLGRALACRGRWVQAEQVARTSLRIFGSCDAPAHVSATETVLAEAARAGRRSADRITEIVEAML
jgi:hypothetical protein